MRDLWIALWVGAAVVFVLERRQFKRLPPGEDRDVAYDIMGLALMCMVILAVLVVTS